MTQALIKLQQAALDDAFLFQAYEGLQTANKLREEYLLIPAKVKEVYLAHLLSQLSEHKVGSLWRLLHIHVPLGFTGKACCLPILRLCQLSSMLCCSTLSPGQTASHAVAVMLST